MTVRTGPPSPRSSGASRAPGPARQPRSLSETRQRFEERARRARRRPWRLAAVAAVVVLLLGVLFWVVALSPLLAVRTVAVTGLTDPRERAAVLAAAGVSTGTPLVRVDLRGAAARVAAIDTVEGAAVVRSWPSTVTIEVTRRTPVLAVKNPQGQLQVVDTTGRRFQAVATAPAGIPVVNASSASPDPRGLLAAISVLTILPADLRGTVSDVTVSSADLVTFKVGAVAVVWGGASDGPKKLAILRVLLGTKPAAIDVSAPDTPVTR